MTQHTTERDVAAKIRNFTPLMDDLVFRYDLITAAVWGRVWRYAQQENGVCQASHEKIADELGISVRTVIRRLQALAEDGYLKDHSPDLKNRPHTYSITKKSRIMITIEGVTESHTNTELGVTESHSTVTESHSTMTESHSGCDRESHEETIKKQIKKQVKKQKKGDFSNFVIPESLNTPIFQKAWEEWLVYRSGRKKPVSQTGGEKLLDKLSRYDPVTAAEMIDQSIENDWQGVFELRGAGSNGRRPGARQSGPAQPKQEAYTREEWDQMLAGAERKEQPL